MHLRLPESGPVGSYSPDYAEEYVEQARATGVDEIGFTEHIFKFRESKELWQLEWMQERCTDDLDEYVGAVKEAKSRGLPVKLLIPYLLYPVAEPIYRDFFASVSKGLVLELSHQGQLYRVLRMFVDLPPWMTSFARSGAQPFHAEEVVARLQQLTEGL